MMRTIRLTAAISVVALAGCSSNPEGGDTTLLASRALFDSIRERTSELAMQVVRRCGST